MGAHAAENTSQTRNSSMPMAVAFSRARRDGAGLRSRPIGNPNKMVTPAMKPSSMVVIKLTGITSTSRAGRAGPPTARVRLTLVRVQPGPALRTPNTGDQASATAGSAVGVAPDEPAVADAWSPVLGVRRAGPG